MAFMRYDPSTNTIFYKSSGIDFQVNHEYLMCMAKKFSIAKTADIMCISTTTLKKYCRILGISRWSYRHFKNVRKQSARKEFDTLYKELELYKQLDNKLLDECSNKQP